MESPVPSYHGDQPYIFVSYAPDDTDFIQGEIQWLHDQGFHVCYDKGSNTRETKGQIERSSLFLLFLSPGVERLRREITHAASKEVSILVVRLAKTKLPCLCPVKWCISCSPS